MPDHIQIGDRRPWEQYQVSEPGQSLFPFHFPVFKAEDIEVYVNGERRTAGYVVRDAGESEGGSVEFDPAVPSGVVTIRRRLTIERSSDFQESGEFRAKVLNDELDYQTAVIQQIADDVARTLRLPATDPDASLELPARDTRKGKCLWFDPVTGDLIAIAGVAGVPISAAMEAVVAAATAAAARALLGLEIGADVQAYDADTLKADTDAALAAGYAQPPTDLGSLDALADDTLALAGTAGNNRFDLVVDVDGEIDATGLPRPIEITATNSGARALTVSGATQTANSADFDGSAGAVNIILFRKDGAGNVDYTIDQRGA